ncbi:hypothetical protein ELG76_04180 [Rhizobium leguminosarum]|uniref:phage adaptor protein n=1 Tax=Rhizobium leguminosarum TaxID=384 RepID=UPI0010309E6A|nr:hypothetical protein [Rhizobium leguminosarum]TBG78618.1 hypothetical protein ELG76_04180 [Rhizobium leguminosarum]
MTTFGDINAAIADDIDDTTGEYSAQISRAVLAAIRYCERNTYYFNETRDVTFPTVQGQEWYDAADNANIPTLVHIVDAWSEDANGDRDPLRRATPQEMELLSDNSASIGEPYAYTYFGQRIRIYPIPAATSYTIRLQLGPYRLTPLSGDTDTNAWLSEAYDMVKARAKYILAKDTLKDAIVAAEALNDYRDQDMALAGETTSRNARGYVCATDF